MKPNTPFPILPTLFGLFLSCFLSAQSPIGAHGLVAGKDYRPGLVVVKFKPEFQSLFDQNRITDPEIAAICATAGAYTARRIFPNHISRPDARVDLSGIVELRFEASADVPVLAARLARSDKFVYAEPRFIGYATGGATAWMPNDSLLGDQWNLPQIQAFEAWELQQGDTAVLIGMVDSGIDWAHPDLVTQIARNTGDPVNGIDDDANGFVDDYVGWDFADVDNDPVELQGPNFHGTGTAGIAAAATNNSIGIAAPGFQSRIVATKTHEDNVDDLSIINAAEAIVYCADRGCKVINNSWGGTGFSHLDFDAVLYATFEKDALVVAAAGNGTSAGNFYPASYPHVLNVGGSVQGDLKYDISNYGTTIDVVAPTVIPATYPGGGYGDFYGTSAAAPMASGAIALVRAHFPEMSAEQAAEQLRMTCDNIDAINPDFAEQLGRGRINLFRALTETGMPSVRFSQAAFDDHNDNYYEAGDTIRLSGVFTNYLADATNLTITASAPGADVTFLNNTLNLGALATGQTADNYSDPFVFIVHPGTLYDQVVEIRLLYSADNYSDFQRFRSVIVNLSYRDLLTNQLKTTVTSRGRLGYNDDDLSQGIGLAYEPAGQLVYFPLALMMGNSAFRVSDGAWTNFSGNDDDFGIMEKVTVVPGSLADEQLTCLFNDSLAGAFRMGLTVRQDVYAWAAAPDDRYFIVAYEIVNHSASNWPNFYAGLHYETELLNYTHNKATQDSALNLAYAWDTDQNIHTGIRLLSPAPFRAYAYDWGDVSGGINLSNGFSTAEKYLTLKGNHPNAALGAPEGGDVGLVAGSGPFNFLAGDTIRLAFAVLAGNSLTELTAAALAAGDRYAGISTAVHQPDDAAGVSLLLFPNPASDLLRIQLPGQSGFEAANISVFDGAGKRWLSQPVFGTDNLLNVSGLPAGLYLVRYVGPHGAAAGCFVRN